ncbi:hypothetical protein [Paraflavitalea speifideaquila]|uniref:hypothetical protein n=1 Tax=Paraflavitalea speifideaquila TaxID=3076558 RepID=UPI0028EDFB39|nr:hypothetical protein [Paraflavitalea speifideiaquila]
MIVPAHGYRYFIFPEGFNASWIRIKANQTCVASAYFHFTAQAHQNQDPMFTPLVGIEENIPLQSNLIRPAQHNKNLQVLDISKDKPQYSEVDAALIFLQPVADSTAQMQKILTFKKIMRPTKHP